MTEGAGKGISLLVPFREDKSGTRTFTWSWLREHWTQVLPDAEIVIGEDDGFPYSKSVAINDAAARATGDIFIILDADVLISTDVIENCAAAIRAASSPLWYMPHSEAFRLTRDCSEKMMMQGKRYETVDAPSPADVEDQTTLAPGFIQILSRHAFEKVGGMDERFRGWGGEDGSFVAAVDTLYGGHTRLSGHVLHLWHDRPGAGSSRTRVWDGQTEITCRELRQAYKAARGDRPAMRALVDKGLGVGSRGSLPL